MVLGSKGVVVVAGYTVGSRSAVAVVPGRGIVGWDPAVDTLNPGRLPYLGPVLYPCPFVPGGGSRVRGSPDVVEEEEVAGTLVG